jgi:hypothetical protein
MIGNGHIHSSSVEHTNDPLNKTIDPASNAQKLAQENRFLRAVVAELLIKNQNLRWALLGHGSREARI